jgi:hypothetical protein
MEKSSAVLGQASIYHLSYKQTYYYTHLSAKTTPNSTINFRHNSALYKGRGVTAEQKTPVGIPRIELLAESKCNQLQPIADADAKMGVSAKPAGCC